MDIRKWWHEYRRETRAITEAMRLTGQERHEALRDLQERREQLGESTPDVSIDGFYPLGQKLIPARTLPDGHPDAPNDDAPEETHQEFEKRLLQELIEKAHVSDEETTRKFDPDEWKRHLRDHLDQVRILSNKAAPHLFFTVPTFKMANEPPCGITAGHDAEEPSGPEISLLDVSEDEETVNAAVAVTSGLDALFRRLGPPPPHLRSDHEPILHGGGGAAE